MNRMPDEMWPERYGHRKTTIPEYIRIVSRIRITLLEIPFDIVFGIVHLLRLVAGALCGI
jgi:hypothetical protein